jgi:hypothetical protein
VGQQLCIKRRATLLSALGLGAVFILLQALVPGPVIQAELAGTYTADHPAASVVLTLLPDGTFTQSAILKRDAQVLKAMGSWHREEGGWGLVFERGFLVTRRNHLGQPTMEPSSARYPAISWLGSIRLGGDECDGAVQYQRQR